MIMLKVRFVGIQMGRILPCKLFMAPTITKFFAFYNFVLQEHLLDSNYANL